MTDDFNPKTHLLVAVDPETKEHFHVTLAELAFDALEIPLPAIPEVAPLIERIERLEAASPAAMPEPQADVSEKLLAVLDVVDSSERRISNVEAVQATGDARLSAIEQRLEALLAGIEAGLAKVDHG